MPPPDTKQAEKDYLARAGSSTWETWKPFSPPGLDTLGDSALLLHDFAVALLTLQPSPDDRILDLGAGGGWCSSLLTQLNRWPVALDISHDMLRAARARPNVSRAVAGDMEALPFATGTFQKALCFSALHHVPNMTAAVTEIARVLDDDGVAFFSEPGQGHADAPVSTAAMRDFGVLEQDVVIDTLVRDCRSAGFADVQIKPLSNSLPHFSLTLEEWENWTRLASSKRPRRALSKIAFGVAEIFGLAKNGPLFEDTFAIRLVRTLRDSAVQHPVVVASKRPTKAPSNVPPWRADISVTQEHVEHGRMTLRIRAVNRGSETWKPTTRSGIAQVSVGVQLLDAKGHLVTRDYHREVLTRQVPPGESVELTGQVPTPSRQDAMLKVDLVAEGVTWFEATGSTAPTIRPGSSLH